MDIRPVSFTDEPEDEPSTSATTLEEFEQETGAPPTPTPASAPASSPSSAPTRSSNPSSSPLLSLTEIQRQTGITYVTLARYARVHEKELGSVSEGTGRNRKYHPQAMEMFREWRDGSKSGRKPATSEYGLKKRETPTPTTPPAAVIPTRKRLTGGKRNKPAKKARRHQAIVVAESTQRPGTPIPNSTIITAMDRAVAEMERAQLVTRLETLKFYLLRVMEPIQAEVERLEKMIGGHT